MTNFDQKTQNVDNKLTNWHAKKKIALVNNHSYLLQIILWFGWDRIAISVECLRWFGELITSVVTIARLLEAGYQLWQAIWEKSTKACHGNKKKLHPLRVGNHSPLSYYSIYGRWQVPKDNAQSMKVWSGKDHNSAFDPSQDSASYANVCGCIITTRTELNRTEWSLKERGKKKKKRVSTRLKLDTLYWL